MSSDLVLAHVVGHRDGPIPLSYALVAGAVALYASFEALRLRWQRSKFAGDTTGRPIRERTQFVLDAPATRWLARGGVLAATAAVVLTAALGGQSDENPSISFVYVLFWVGFVPLSLLLGPIWRAVNPIRTVHAVVSALLRRPAERGLLPLPGWLGYWPAASGLFAFAWLELAAPGRTQPATLLIWFSCYAGIHLVAALVFGSKWLDRGDAFEVYFGLIGRLAPWGRRDDGVLVRRHPLDGVDGTPQRRGLVALVSVMLGATAYDSLSNTSWWKGVLASSAGAPAVAAAGLLGVVVAISAAFGGSAYLAGLLARLQARGLATRLAHSVIPIVVGYVLAHYLSVLLVGLQDGFEVTVAAMNGTAHAGELGSVHSAHTPAPARLPDPFVMSAIQVTAVLAGHVVGIVSTHDRAVRLFPAKLAVRAQVPLFVCMLAFTLGGLVLLYRS